MTCELMNTLLFETVTHRHNLSFDKQNNNSLALTAFETSGGGGGGGGVRGDGDGNAVMQFYWPIFFFTFYFKLNHKLVYLH